MKSAYGRQTPPPDKSDDLEAQEGQRAIAVHTLEHLGTSDTGIVPLLWRKQLQRRDNGHDPLNVVRDAARGIPIHAWNTILSPAEAAAHRGEEV